VAVGAAVALTAANHFGIQKVGRLNVAIVLVTVGALGLFVVCGLPAVRSEHLRPFAPAGARGVLEAAALLFFAYTGYARVATLGEEVHDPQRTIPRAIVIALAFASLLYLAVGFVAVGTIGAEAMGNTAAPLQRAAEGLAIRGIETAIGVGASTAMLGVLLSQLLAISRMAFAMARRGDLPRALGHVGERHGVPDVALAAAGAVIVVLVVAGTLDGVIAAASFTILVYYAITNLAALRLEAGERRYPRWTAAAGLASCVVLAASLRPGTIVAGGVLLGAGFTVRAALQRGR
jgi:APA family basic amino acid/polyamine antiporter